MRLARNVELAMKRSVGPHVRLGVQRGFTGRDGGTLSQNFRPSSQPPSWNRSNRDSSYSPKQDQWVAGVVFETPKQPVSGARGTRENKGELSSMKVEGQVGGIPILILLDSVTHNFISPKLVKSLGLTIHGTRRMSIKLGGGHRVFSQGVCQKLKVDIGSYCCLIDAYILNIGGLDLILVFAWLRTLGDVIGNWETMTMSFQVSGQEFTLEGAAKPNQVVSSLHSLVHNPYFGNIQPNCMKGNHDARGTQILTNMQ
ncbi:Aspartic peptidase domain superfamily [Sesbania bispinosa]|nr:Aspartic peptidase domain superfamily [Sesbania bispinosa]